MMSIGAKIHSVEIRETNSFYIHPKCMKCNSTVYKVLGRKPNQWTLKKKKLYKWFIWLFTYYDFSEFYILINNLQELTEESHQIYLVAQKVHLGMEKAEVFGQPYSKDVPTFDKVSM